MAHPKYSQDEIIQSLFEVFRQHGYNGASMEVLAKATGLKKSSLYHRFPGGKGEMAQEVLKMVSSWITEHIVKIVHLNLSAEKKLGQIMDHVFELYEGGRKSCILRSMSTESGLAKFGSIIGKCFTDLHHGLQELALQFGKTEVDADRLAQERIIKIQGSLILGLGTEKPRLFQQTLSEVETSFRT